MSFEQVSEMVSKGKTLGAGCQLSFFYLGVIDFLEMLFSELCLFSSSQVDIFVFFCWGVVWIFSFHAAGSVGLFFCWVHLRRFLESFRCCSVLIGVCGGKTPGPSIVPTFGSSRLPLASLLSFFGLAVELVHQSSETLSVFLLKPLSEALSGFKRQKLRAIRRVGDSFRGNSKRQIIQCMVTGPS